MPADGRWSKNASRWQMGFNSAFKGLICPKIVIKQNQLLLFFFKEIPVNIFLNPPTFF